MSLPFAYLLTSLPLYIEQIDSKRSALFRNEGIRSVPAMRIWERMTWMWTPLSLDWLVREDRNRKVLGFSHEDHGAFVKKKIPYNFSVKPIHWVH